MLGLIIKTLPMITVEFAIWSKQSACKDRFSKHHRSRHKFSACSGNPENVPDISVLQRRLRNVQAPGSTWSCTMVRGFRPTISVCLSCNCEDLWGHIVIQLFLTIGTQPLWMLLTCSVTWVIVTWVTLVTLGRLTYIWHCAPTWVLFGSSLTYGRSSGRGFIFCFATRVISMFGRGTLWIINSWFGN